MEKLTMNVCEMAQQLGISRVKAYTLTKRKGFPALHLGKRIVIPIESLKGWLVENAGRDDSGT